MIKKNVLLFVPMIGGGGVEKNLFLIANYLSNKFQKISIISTSKKYKNKFNKNVEFITPKNKLWNRSLKIINILIKGNIELPQKYDWLYFDDKNIIFHRVTLQNSFSEFGIPKDHSILSCEIAYSENDKIANLAKNKLLRKCIKDVKSIEKFKDIDIVETHFIDAKSVYPGIYSGYEEELSKLK